MTNSSITERVTESSPPFPLIDKHSHQKKFEKFWGEKIIIYLIRVITNPELVVQSTHSISSLKLTMEMDSGADSVSSTPRSVHHKHPLSDDKPLVRLMVSFGGKILPRPHDNQLRYVGGDTRIVAVNRSTSFSLLLSKLSKLLLTLKTHPPPPLLLLLILLSNTSFPTKN